jgi:hypothetical protein
LNNGSIFDNLNENFTIRNQVRLSTLIALLLFAFISLSAGNSVSQAKWWKDKKYKNEAARAKYELCKRTFEEVEKGLSYFNTSYISQYFSSLVYLDIFGNEKGFYSPSQAEIILSNFMDNFPVQDFSYKSSSRYNNYASAKGPYEFRKGNTRGSFSGTVSLKYKDKQWFVDQIIIN